MQLCPTFTLIVKFCRPIHLDEEIPAFNLFFLRCRWTLGLFLRYFVLALSIFPSMINPGLNVRVCVLQNILCSGDEVYDTVNRGYGCLFHQRKQNCKISYFLSCWVKV